MNTVERLRTAARQALETIRGQQTEQLQREQSQPNGQVRQMDDPDRQMQEQHVRIREQAYQEHQQRAQREAAQGGGV